MNILEVVIGSNHFLIQPQTVGKNEGAPMILVRQSAKTLSSILASDLRIFGPVSLGNVQLPVCSRPAYDFSDSRIA